MSIQKLRKTNADKLRSLIKLGRGGFRLRSADFVPEWVQHLNGGEDDPLSECVTKLASGVKIRGRKRRRDA